MIYPKDTLFKHHLYKFLLSHPDLFLKRATLLDIFTTSEFPLVEEQEGDYILKIENEPYKGQFVQTTKDDFLCIVTGYERVKSRTYKVTLSALEIAVAKTFDRDPIANVSDVLLIPNKLLSIKEDGSTKTTIGRFIANYTILQKPFNSIIPYINKRVSSGDIEKIVSNEIIKMTITAQQMERYTRNAYFVGHLSQICVPTFSKKSLTSDPNLLKRKAELIQQFKSRLEKGDAVAMTLIEDELIKMDKDWLKGDVSMGFYEKDAKGFNVQRKRMYVAMGMLEKFGDKGTFNFVEGALSEGWAKKDFPALSNEIRQGSFLRALETAKGGEQAKFIIRALRNVKITETDCKTTRGIATEINRFNMTLLDNRSIVVGTEIKKVDRNFIASNVGKTIVLRDPQTCATHDGYCQVCMGSIFESLSTESLTMDGNEIGAFFLKNSLKATHGTSVKSTVINSLDEFLT